MSPPESVLYLDRDSENANLARASHNAVVSSEVVNVAGGKSSENSLFSFASPAIESLSPGYVFLSASLTYDFVIRGTGFGLRPEDIVSVHVGDNPCSNVQWHLAKHFQVQQDGTWAFWLATRA